MIPDGASLMIGGFMGVGTPERLIDEMVRQGKRDLTVIANDTAMPGEGHRQARSARSCVRKAIASHIGLNPETQQQMMAGEMEVELVPQGTLIERIRAGGYGLGGVLTPTGVGTVVEEGKRKIEVDGKDYLLETALRADFALVQAFLADYLGNLSYALTARNFNPVIAMAADTVIVERRAHRAGRRDRARSRRDAGAARRLSRCQRVTRHGAHRPSSPSASRASSSPACWSISASASRPWSQTTCPTGMHVFFQSENGLIGTGPLPEEGMAHPTLTDAGGGRSRALPGASTFDSAMSFGLIRGGHLDMTVLGGLQVDEGPARQLDDPGKMVPGMGGAMDLVTGAKRVIVAMQHTAKGKPKIVAAMHAAADVDAPGRSVVTELAVIAFSEAGAVLQETAPGVGVGDVMANTEAKLLVPERVPAMAI